MMKLVLVLAVASCAEALAMVRPGLALRSSTTPRTSAAAMQFGKKKAKIPTLEERGYWAGESRWLAAALQWTRAGLARVLTIRTPLCSPGSACRPDAVTDLRRAAPLCRRVGVR